MKLIVAMVQPEKLESIKKKLFDNDIKKMTITNVLGCGQQAGYNENYRGSVKEVHLLKKIRIEIALTDDFVEQAISLIIEGAKTGNIGDGKIFVLPIENCIRIRTEEKGSDAIG